MAINFSVRWSDNTAELKRHLSEGLNQIEATRASVDKLARSLGGENVIRAAHNLAAALQKVGGEAGALAAVEKLTSAERDRANATLDRAVQKYTALGQAIPAPISALHQLIKAQVDAGHAADSTARKTSALGDTFKGVFAGFTAVALVNRAVGVITDLGREALNTASSLVDLSNKTGLSTDTIQRMQFVAKQSGSDMSTFADAAFKMGVNIEEGTVKARQGAERLGLSFVALRAASPDQQFDMVVQALERMEDPQIRNAAAFELFGRTAKEILPAIVDGYTKIAEGATVAGEEQVKALDAAGDAWDRWKTRTTSSVISAVGTFILMRQAVNELTQEERDFILHTDQSAKTTDGFTAALIRGAEAKRRFGNLSISPLGAQDIPLPSETKPAAELESYREQLRKATAEVASLTAAQRLEISAGQKVGATALEIADRFNVSELAIKLFKNEVGQTATKVKALTKTLDETADLLKVWGRQLTLIEGATSRWELKTLDLSAAAKELGIALPIPEVEALLATNLDGVMALWAASLLKVENGFGDLGDDITKMGRQIRPTLADIGQGLTKAKDPADQLGRAFEQLGRQIGGAMGNAVSDIGFFVVKFREAKIATDRISAGIQGGIAAIGAFTTAGSRGSNIANYAGQGASIGTAILPGYGTAIGAGVGALVGAFKKPEDEKAAEEQFNAFKKQLADLFDTTASAQLKMQVGTDAWAKMVETVSAAYVATGRTSAEALADLDRAALHTRVDLEKLPEDLEKINKILQRTLNFGQLAAASASAVGLIDKSFLDLLNHAKELNGVTQSMKDFVSAQVELSEAGLGSALKITNDAYAKRKDLLKQIASETDTAKLADLNAQLLTQNQIIDATGIHSQQSADAVSGALIGILNSQQAAGKSFLESIRAVAPSVESLQAQMEAAGYSGGAAFDFLKGQVALVNDAVAGPALQAIEGYAQGLTGLHNAGLLTQDSFAGLSSQIGATRDALVAQGKDGGQVLSAMRGPLQTLWELQTKFGYTTDESTQALIDQAKEQGLVGDKFKPVGEQMLDATNRIAFAMEGVARVFGVVIPEAAGTGAAGIQNALDRIKSDPASLDPLKDALAIDLPSHAAIGAEGIGESLKDAIDSGIWSDKLADMKKQLEATGAGAEKGAGEATTEFERMSRALTEAITTTGTVSEDSIQDALTMLLQEFGGLPKSAMDAATGISDELSRIRIPRVRIPIDFSLPGPIETIGMAEGGRGRAMGPTLFYSGGQEDFAFSGENRRFKPMPVVSAEESSGRSNWRVHDADRSPDMRPVADAIRDALGRAVYINIDGKNLVIAVAETLVKGHGRDDLVNAMGLA